MVAKLFINNINNYPEVNHKDFDRTNNHVDNLEWETHEYNIKYTVLHNRHIARDGRMKGENNSMYGTHHSVESKQKLSKRMSGKNHPLFGTHCSDITKAKQRATLFATLSKKKENAL